MMWTLKAARARAAQKEITSLVVFAFEATNDRDQLLALVDRASAFIADRGCHDDSCRVNYGRCTCPVGEMLRELGAGACGR